MTSSQHGPYVLGLDLGTSSLKALVADAAGVVRATVSHPYALQRPRPGWAEQTPADWERALLPVMRQLRERGVALDAIAAIGLSGQMHGLVLLDAAGDALGPCHIWADTRCANEARLMEERIGRERLRRTSGSPAYTSATAGKLLWVREHEPERLRAAAHLLLPKDYLRWRLTGTLATDVSDASGTQFCDISTRDWSGELLDALDISPDLLPPVYESTAVTGS
ncbi:MAG TPA: FGGY family carbohydrate kinase, partial [Ktedonobacterales bacterium]